MFSKVARKKSCTLHSGPSATPSTHLPHTLLSQQNWLYSHTANCISVAILHLPIGTAWSLQLFTQPPSFPHLWQLSVYSLCLWVKSFLKEMKVLKLMLLILTIIILWIFTLHEWEWLAPKIKEKFIHMKCLTGDGSPVIRTLMSFPSSSHLLNFL